MPAYNLVAVDVEDWFHILDLREAPDLEAWSHLESRVGRNVQLILDEMDACGARCTFFYLGWIAERQPEIVRETYRRGHEIASHGYSHQLVWSQTRDEFRADIRKAKQILEDTIGAPVCGYRAPGFSITPETTWAFDEIAAAGYTYDSSVFPGSHGHGGIHKAPLMPHVLQTASGELFEFPSSVVSIFGRRVAFFGGGYLRLFPYWLIEAMSGIVLRENRPVIYYVHPREVEPDHPRLPMPVGRRFRCYVNLDTTIPKLRRVMRQRTCITLGEWMRAQKNQADMPVLKLVPAQDYS